MVVQYAGDEESDYRFVDWTFSVEGVDWTSLKRARAKRPKELAPARECLLPCRADNTLYLTALTIPLRYCAECLTVLSASHQIVHRALSRICLHCALSHSASHSKQCTTLTFCTQLFL